MHSGYCGACYRDPEEPWCRDHGGGAEVESGEAVREEYDEETIEGDGHKQRQIGEKEN